MQIPAGKCASLARCCGEAMKDSSLLGQVPFQVSALPLSSFKSLNKHLMQLHQDLLFDLHG